MRKKSVLLLLKTFLQHKQTEPERISTLQYNKEINKALAAVEAGHYITHEAMLRESSAWDKNNMVSQA